MHWSFNTQKSVSSTEKSAENLQPFLQENVISVVESASQLISPLFYNAIKSVWSTLLFIYIAFAYSPLSVPNQNRCVFP